MTYETGVHLPPKPRCIYYSSWNPHHLNLEVLKKEKAWKVKGQLQIKQLISTANKRQTINV